MSRTEISPCSTFPRVLLFIHSWRWLSPLHTFLPAGKKYKSLKFKNIASKLHISHFSHHIVILDSWPYIAAREAGMSFFFPGNHVLSPTWPIPTPKNWDFIAIERKNYFWKVTSIYLRTLPLKPSKYMGPPFKPFPIQAHTPLMKISKLLSWIYDFIQLSSSYFLMLFRFCQLDLTGSRERHRSLCALRSSLGVFILWTVECNHTI